MTTINASTALKFLFLSLLLAAASFGEAQASRTKASAKSSKAAIPTNGSPTTFTLNVDQDYCDVSLPYSYQSTKSNITIKVGSSGSWNTVLDNDWNANPSLLRTGAPATAPISLSFDHAMATYGNGGKDDPPTSAGSLNDDGGSILGSPKNELNTNTYDVQRLLVRTLFGPNPFQVACAYPYLKYPQADVSSVQLHTGPDGKQLTLFTKGAGSYFSLNDEKAPKYYLINIVRWKDAPPPKGASANTPFFQAASDNWYLLNYSDSQDRQQDISKWFYKITPALVSDTLRIIGNEKVMFLGIHLAPLPVLGTSGVPNPNPNSGSATERAWFDDVSLKYTFQATAATPTNMADLATLLSIVLSNVGISPPAAAPRIPPTMTNLLNELNTTLERLQIDLFLHQVSPSVLTTVPTTQDYGTGPTSVALLKVVSNTIQVDASLEAQIKSLADTGKAIAAVTRDIASLNNLEASLTSDPILTTYQGRYAAGLLTNLTNLPVTLASNWAATFTGSPVAPQWPGNAGTYDLTTSATTVADKSNRAGLSSSSPPTTPGDTPAASSTICTIGLATGSNSSQAACSDQPNKVLNEGRSRWDVSFIIPITGYQDLSFQAATSGPNIITSKTITRENAYGVFDLFLVPEDLISPPYVGIPHIVVGLPFAGQVFNKPYFAVGETLNFPQAIGKVPFLSKLPVIGNLSQKDLPLFVRPVFGWVYNKEFPAGSTHSYRSLKPQWALELSFSSIKNAVQTFSKSSGGSNTTKSITPSSVPSTN
jgi:hypothetical protein